MKYQLKTFGGDTLLLSDNQYKAIVNLYDQGATEFKIGDQRIPRSSISFLGFTDGATEAIRAEDQNYMRSLPNEEAKQLREKRFEEARLLASKKETKQLEAAKERVWKGLGGQTLAVEIKSETTAALPISNEEEENGEPMYYLNEFGEKQYS